MIKKLFSSIYILTLGVSLSHAQVGIGTTSPRAALDVSNNSNGGILIPAYALTTHTTSSPVVDLSNGGDPTDGTLIFNTNATASGVDRGFVYWDGGIWNNIAASETQTTPQYGQMFKTGFQNLNASNQIIEFERNGVSSSGITVTSNYIETGTQTGIYEFSYSILVTLTGSPGNNTVVQDLFFLNQGTSLNKIPNSDTIASVTSRGVWTTVSKTMLINVTSPNQRFYVISQFDEPFMSVGPDSKLSVKLIDPT